MSRFHHWFSGSFNQPAFQHISNRPLIFGRTELLTAQLSMSTSTVSKLCKQ